MYAYPLYLPRVSLLKGETMEPVNYYQQEMDKQMLALRRRVAESVSATYAEWDRDTEGPGETIDVTCDVVEPLALPPAT